MTRFKVTEVNVADVPGRRTLRQDFIEDVKARLEKTEARFALRYEFDDEKEAERYRQSLMGALPKGSVATKKHLNGGNCYLFVWRGPEYGKL